MFKFTINDFIKNINFAINEIKIIEILFDKLFVFVIAISEHNNIFFLVINIRRSSFIIL